MLILVPAHSRIPARIRRRGRADKAGTRRQQIMFDLQVRRVSWTVIGDRHGVAHHASDRDFAR